MRVAGERLISSTALIAMIEVANSAVSKLVRSGDWLLRMAGLHGWPQVEREVCNLTWSAAGVSAP
jgi:hypothetical protein